MLVVTPPPAPPPRKTRPIESPTPATVQLAKTAVGSSTNAAGDAAFISPPAMKALRAPTPTDSEGSTSAAPTRSSTPFNELQGLECEGHEHNADEDVTMFSSDIHEPPSPDPEEEFCRPRRRGDKELRSLSDMFSFNLFL